MLPAGRLGVLLTVRLDIGARGGGGGDDADEASGPLGELKDDAVATYDL